MKIYTKTGDRGETGLFAGPRVSKDHSRIEAFGTVDELNAAVGVVRAAGAMEAIDDLLGGIQHHLFAIGAELATPDPAAHSTDLICEEHVLGLERAIDQYESELPELKQFVLPGGTSTAAALHLARAVCRRAERRVVTLAHAESSAAFDQVIPYLNRLGDLLFVLARATNATAKLPDVIWVSPRADG
jgi:cob(I)alamin adenosyltransferase